MADQDADGAGPDRAVAGDSFAYDSYGRIQTDTRAFDGITTSFVYTPTYSNRDLLLGLTIKQGASSLFDWSAHYDALGQVEWLQLAGYGGGPLMKADFAYDLAGQTKTLSRTQGATSAARTNLGYDNQGRLVSLSHQQPGANSLAQIARYDMAYDAANRITRIDSSVDEASVYSYDKTGQLTAAQMTFEVDEAYQYDQNGNRTSGGSLHNGVHKNLIKEDAKYQYEYDGENNRTKRLEKATGNYQEYVWDHRNRLIEVRFKTAAGVLTKTVKYFYDASDMKVREEVTAGASSVNKYFVYDGGNVVLDFVDTDGRVTGNPPTLDKRYFQGPGVDQLLAQERFANNVSQQVLWILPDHLGSTRDLVDTLGKVVAHYQYDSFGVLLDGRENVTRYQFTGREHDSHTDLNYHRARWYDPISGKWISEDPIGFEAGDANITSYVGNEVLNAVDSWGLFAISVSFEAFIPKSLGKDVLNNPNPSVRWGAEPGTAGTSFAYFATDDRETIQQAGTYRIATFIAGIDSSDVGTRVKQTAQASTNPGVSEQIRVTEFRDHAGRFGGGYKLKYVPGTWRTRRASLSADSIVVEDFGEYSTIKVVGGAGYAFATFAPSIDYSFQVTLYRCDNAIYVTGQARHNRFPAYGALVNNGQVYEYRPTGKGPGIVNLNTSTNGIFDSVILNG